MRQYNCSRYLRCLSDAAIDNLFFSCENCVSCNIREPHGNDPECREEALACCRLLLALFEIGAEPPSDIYGYKITSYGGVLKAVRRVDGKRHIIHLGTLDGAKEKIQRYISRRVLN